MEIHWIAVAINRLKIIMVTFFENNLVLFLSSYIVAVVAWLLTSRLAKLRIRRAVRASIIFLVFPIFYTGHPFLYYQCWMLLLVYIVKLKVLWLLLFLAIWGIFILISQIKVARKQ